MLRWGGRVIGGLLVVIGLIWLLQGLDLMGGSYMSGDLLWAGAGAMLVVFGLLLILLFSHIGSR